ncbi:MAG: hypothetical protein ACTIMT_07335 [Marinomonadaceae bacterium]
MSYLMSKLNTNRLLKNRLTTAVESDEYEWKGWDAWVEMKE